MWIVIFLILIAMLFVIIRVPNGKRARENRLKNKFDFYLRGMDAGFALSEIKTLWSGIKYSNFRKPSRIFGSIESLDALIGELSGSKSFLERDELEDETQALKNLFAYRRDIELNRMKHQLGLKSTRHIPIGQELKIRVSGAGTYSSRVVENEDGYLTITIPVGDPLPMGFSWRQGNLNVYLWRKDDGGYFFQTRVMGKFYDKHSLLFHLKHSDGIIRNQRRGVLRAPTRINARLYLRKNPKTFDDLIESSLERDCLITGISEGGVSLITSGFVRKGKILRLQFTLQNEGVVVAGAVKGSHYDQTRDESTLHIEFMPIPENLRMLFLSYILNINRKRQNAIENDSAELTHGIKQPEDQIPDSDEEVEEGEPVEELKDILED